MPNDRDHLLHTVQLAHAARAAGNLPIGALIVLDEKMIAEGQNRLWFPVTSPGLHAEIDALARVDTSLWPRAREMTLYTSLEPCLMCLSTILLHRIGRVVYGARDPRGGGLCTVGKMPPSFEMFYAETEVAGPALPEQCDELFRQSVEIIEQHRNR
ncbi:MAG: nucleoside deaminase [Anaerolineales bacterium]|nr:nucleoside deaminase [Anaerolineales bacterium]